MVKNSEASERGDWVQATITYVAATVVFAPVLLWLFRQTRHHEQLSQALVILLGLGAFLAWENREKLRLRLTHDRTSLCFLLGAFVLASLQFLTPELPLILIAFLLAVAGLLRFTFGARAAVATGPLLLALGFFTLLVIFLPAFDWPLRILAGKWSAYLLGLLGGDTGLYYVAGPVPHLTLESAGKPFIVAAECNGFGLLSSSLLITLGLGYYRRLAWLDFALLLAGSVFLALGANILRIICIVLLAPKVSNYHVMHEAVGIAIYYASLGLICWLVWTCPRRRAF